MQRQSRHFKPDPFFCSSTFFLFILFFLVTAKWGEKSMTKNYTGRLHQDSKGQPLLMNVFVSIFRGRCFSLRTSDQQMERWFFCGYKALTKCQVRMYVHQIKAQSNWEWLECFRGSLVSLIEILRIGIFVRKQWLGFRNTYSPVCSIVNSCISNSASQNTRSAFKVLVNKKNHLESHLRSERCLSGVLGEKRDFDKQHYLPFFLSLVENLKTKDEAKQSNQLSLIAS